MYTMMIVDDEKRILKAMERIFRCLDDVTIEYLQCPATALERSRTATFDVIMSDYRMPEMNGIEFLTRTRQYQPDSRRIILSAHIDANSLTQAINEAGIDEFLTKPWDNDVLVKTVYDACRRKTSTLPENN